MKTTSPTSSPSSKTTRSARTSPRTRTIGEVMTGQPWTIGKQQTLKKAHEMMRAHGIRHLPVLERAHVVGMVSQRDLYFFETISGVDAHVDVVEDAMTSEVYVVGPDSTLADVTTVMLERHLGSAVVVEGERVVGIFTVSDALRLLREQ